VPGEAGRTLTNKQQCDPEDSKKRKERLEGRIQRERTEPKEAVKKEGPGWS